MYSYVHEIDLAISSWRHNIKTSSQSSGRAAKQECASCHALPDPKWKYQPSSSLLQVSEHCATFCSLQNKSSTICALVRSTTYLLVLPTGHHHGQADTSSKVDIFTASGAVVNGEYLAGSSGRKPYTFTLMTQQCPKGPSFRVSLHIYIHLLLLQVPKDPLWRMAATLE